MCKMPLPLFDPVLIGPVIAIINVVTGALLSELYLLIVIVVSLGVGIHKLIDFKRNS